MNHLLALQMAVYALAAQTAPSWRDPSPHQVRMITVDSAVKLEVLDWGGTGRPIVFVGGASVTMNVTKGGTRWSRVEEPQTFGAKLREGAGPVAGVAGDDCVGIGSNAACGRIRPRVAGAESSASRDRHHRVAVWVGLQTTASARCPTKAICRSKQARRDAFELLGAACETQAAVVFGERRSVVAVTDVTPELALYASRHSLQYLHALGELRVQVGAFGNRILELERRLDRATCCRASAWSTSLIGVSPWPSGTFGPLLRLRSLTCTWVIRS